MMAIFKFDPLTGRRRRTIELAIAFTCATLIACPAQVNAGVVYTFNKLTNNGGPSVASQLSVEVLAVSTTQVAFKFHNVGSIAASITDIYFDDGTLLDISKIETSLGVNYSEGAKPGNLPGGEAINFNTSKGFLADSDSPIMTNGVNNTLTDAEWVKITFDLKGDPYLTKELALKGIIDAMEMSLKSPGVDLYGGLRIGLHVQSIGPSGNSDSYVNGREDNIITEVPEPATVTLSAIGIVASSGNLLRRRFQYLVSAKTP